MRVCIGYLGSLSWACCLGWVGMRLGWGRNRRMSLLVLPKPAVWEGGRAVCTLCAALSGLLHGLTGESGIVGSSEGSPAFLAVRVWGGR